MEYLKSLLKNRISIVMVLIQWIFILSIFLDFLRYSNPRLYLGEFSHFLFLILNLPAILTATLIWSPYYFIDMLDVFAGGAAATSLFTITIQWLIIGKLVSQIIDRKQQKVIEHSIFNAD